MYISLYCHYPRFVLLFFTSIPVPFDHIVYFILICIFVNYPKLFFLEAVRLKIIVFLVENQLTCLSSVMTLRNMNIDMYYNFFSILLVILSA